MSSNVNSNYRNKLNQIVAAAELGKLSTPAPRAKVLPLPIDYTISYIIMSILSQLSIQDLVNFSRSSKFCNQLATQYGWKRIIYVALAFGREKWANAFGEKVVQGEPIGEDWYSLPDNIVDEFRKFHKALPKIVGNSAVIRITKKHLKLVWIPKTLNGKLTHENLNKLATEKKGSSVIKDDNRLLQLINTININCSYWLLITDFGLPHTGGNAMSGSSISLKAIVEQCYPMIGLTDYSAPNSLELATYMVSQSTENIGTGMICNPAIRCSDTFNRGQPIILCEKKDFVKDTTVGPGVALDSHKEPYQIIVGSDTHDFYHYNFFDVPVKRFMREEAPEKERGIQNASSEDVD